MGEVSDPSGARDECRKGRLGLACGVIPHQGHVIVLHRVVCCIIMAGNGEIRTIYF